jgi:hypothetical protein
MTQSTKTDELIAVLSRSPHAASHGPTATVIVSAFAAVVIALFLSLVWLKPRPDLSAALIAHNHVFLLKLVFTVCIVLAVLPVVRTLSIPGRRTGPWSILAALPFIVILVPVLNELAGVSPHEWSHHVGRASWLDCLWKIPALAIPAFVILAFGARRLAPTDLVRAGAYIGLAAGGIGAIGYAFHCHDDSVAFVAMSYTLAILEMTLIGAVLGPRILRWTSHAKTT